MSWRTLCPPSFSALATVSLLAVGCGNASSTTVARTTTASPTGALEYARCMRSHGVPNFPDPAAGRGADKAAAIRALQTVSGSRAQAAQTDCVHVNGGSPGSGQGSVPSRARTAAVLAFARCLRTHGFPRFPDPTTDGQITHEMVANAGIDLHQPAVAQAGDACVSVTHGLVTKTNVARFIAGR